MIEEVIHEPCEACTNSFPVEEMAFETLEIDRGLKVWICEECFLDIKRMQEGFL